MSSGEGAGKRLTCLPLIALLEQQVNSLRNAFEIGL